MKLIFERNQRSGGMLGNKQVFSTTVKAEISDAERQAIKKYRLDDEVLYVDGDAGHVDPHSTLSMLKGIVKAASLGKLRVRDLVGGKTFENEDIAGMLATEEHIHTAAKNLKLYFDAAASFGGRVELEL